MPIRYIVGFFVIFGKRLLKKTESCQPFSIGVLRRFPALHVVIHRLRNLFGMLDRFNDRARTRYDVTAGKDARARRSAVFVGNEQTACVASMPFVVDTMRSRGPWLMEMMVLDAS